MGKRNRGRRRRPTVDISGVAYAKCLCCDNPVQVGVTDMCAPCTFGEWESFYEYPPLTYEDVRREKAELAEEMKGWEKQRAARRQLEAEKKQAT